MVQVVAEALGVPLEDVRLLQGDTDVSPYGGGTAGNRSAVIAGGVARVSAAKVREKVLEIAEHQPEAAAADSRSGTASSPSRGRPARAPSRLPRWPAWPTTPRGAARRRG